MLERECRVCHRGPRGRNPRRRGEVRTGAGEVCLGSVDGDRYFAIDDMCPHMGASLAGGFVENGIVTCPWHYWRFRLSDGAWADNPRIKIGSYPVHVVDGEIRLELPDSEEKPCPVSAPSSSG